MGTGQLVAGKWIAKPLLTHNDVDGSHRIAKSKFRNWVAKDGTPGPTGVGGFRAESNRYHLYIALSCPFAHRTIIMRLDLQLHKKRTIALLIHYF